MIFFWRKYIFNK